ncbi:MAG: DUF6198 family protein [Clostridiales bacterium]|nr:DUF6198 family protein [Clostridiales bacterium]
MKKPVFYTEAAYIAGLLFLALGTAFMERADLGISMVVAPAYLIHLKLSQSAAFYTFGTSEYVFQAFLILLLALVMRRFKRAYLFSFATAVIYGFTLDLFMSLAARIPIAGFAMRLVFYAAGLALCSVGVAFFFKTYLIPEAYELFVKEIAEKLGAKTAAVKTVYDIVSCAVGVALSFIFFGFGRFEGVKIGTIVCALVNGPLIGLVSSLMDRAFEFRDALPLRGFFGR